MKNVYCLVQETMQLLKITDVKLYVPSVTFSVEDNAKLSNLLNEGFKGPIHWNEYKVTPNKIVEILMIIEILMLMINNT